MPVLISEKQLKTKPPNKTKTYSDTKQKGFVLRHTPNGALTFFFVYLDRTKLHPTTKKPTRDWYKIGEYDQVREDGEKWNPINAREKATVLAGLIAQGKSIRAIQQRDVAVVIAGGVTFQQLHDEYFDWCKELLLRDWGLVPRKESWQNMQYSVARALGMWRKRIACEITTKEIMALYKAYVAEGHPAQANCVLGDLRTMFNWAMDPDLAYIKVNPCPLLHKDKKAIEKRHVGKKRVLKRAEIKTLWLGLDDPKCPGDRFSKLALKLSLVSVLRSGEVTKLPRAGVAPDRSTVMVPLKAVKSRRAPGASDVVQPMNSLAREILDEALSIGNPDREYAFPKNRNHHMPESPNRRGLGGHMSQQSLSCLMTRKSTDKNGRMGINEYLGLSSEGGEVTPLVLRRTGATMLSQLGISQAVIGKVMTHRTKDKDAAPVTAEYIVDMPIIERPVDHRVEALDRLDVAFREIIGLPAPKPTAKLRLVKTATQSKPAKPRPLKAA